ncbi:MAG: hypothetical protein JSR47_06590 [Proteobacteria bacterium]|nr:hypothetical protein [Pseudomonadota bacterium]
MSTDASETRRIASVTIAIVALTWLVAVGAIWRSYSNSVETWTSTAGLAAEMAAAYSGKSIAAADLVLKSMLDWISEEDIRTSDQFRQVFSQRHYFDKLRERIANIEQIDVATFIATDGQIIIFSRSFPQPGINLADRDYFKEQIRPTPPPTSLGNVVQNRGTGRWTFYKARQARSRDGNILGVVIVGIEAEYFAEFFRRIVPSADSSITFWRTDGTVLASSSNKGGVLGRRFPNAVSSSLFREHPQGASKWLTTPRLINDSNEHERILTMRPIANEPAYVTISIGAETIFAAWRTDRNVTLALALGLTGIILWASRQSLHYQTANKRRRALEFERQILQAVVDMPLALTAILASDGRILRSSLSFDAAFRTFVQSGSLRLADVAGGESIAQFIREPRDQLQTDINVPTPTGERRVYHVAIVKKEIPGLGPCMVVVASDETEHRAAQVALAQSAKMVTLGEMATGMAHELNQPINIIHMAVQNALGELEFLDSDLPPAAPTPEIISLITEKLTIILSQTTRAASLISHMRVFGRAPNEASSPFDARSACEGALNLVGQQIRTRGIALNVEVDDRPTMVMGHQTLLEQVLVNLLINARDALAASGYAEKRIDVACHATNASIILEVSDNGPGIPDSIRDRVFDPFFTTKETGSGTGLGLSISFGIIKDMGGTLSLARSIAGARFLIELPPIFSY